MNPLLKLLALNKDKGQPIKAEIGDAEATIYVYDVIVSDDMWGGVSAETFVRELNAITAPIIHLRINSPGGDVFASRAMVQAMREHKSTIIAHVDGMAASAATDLVCAAEQAYINDGGMFMIHNAWTIAMGNKDDFLKVAELLERVDQVIAQNYVEKSGQSSDQIIEWMNAETYFFGQEAVDAGFIDAIAETAPKAKIDWDLSAYQHPPAAAQAKPEPVNNQPAPPPDPAPEPTDLSLYYKQLEVVQLTA